MKKILFTAVSALAFASFADGVASTEFGALCVPSSTAETIVSVPWLESGTGAENISVSNLVLTAGLHDGDTLDLYQGGTLAKGWVIENGAWKPGDKGSGSDQTKIVRGSALILTRTNPIGSCFYLMGKPATGTGHVDLQPSGYTMIAPTKVDAATSISSLTWNNLEAKKDYLYVFKDGVLKTYRYFTNGWYDMSTGAQTTGSEIPAGTGAWFYTKSATTGKSVDL